MLVHTNVVSIMAAYSGLLCVHVVYRARRDCVMSGAVDRVVYGLDRRSSPYTTRSTDGRWYLTQRVNG